MLNYFVGLRSSLHSAFFYLKINPVVLETSENFKMYACRCYNHTLHMCIASIESLTIDEAYWTQSDVKIWDFREQVEEYKAPVQKVWKIYSI